VSILHGVPLRASDVQPFFDKPAPISNDAGLNMFFQQLGRKDQAGHFSEKQMMLTAWQATGLAANDTFELPAFVS